MEKAPDTRDLALSELTDELREQPTPPVDWNRVEQGLFAAIESEASSQAAPPAGRRPSLLSGLAAAAGVLFAVFALHGRSAMQKEAPVKIADTTPTESEQTIDGTALRVGRQLVSDTGPVNVHHGERASWILEPGSAAHLVRRGERVVVSLDRGALSAEVTPQPVAETFVVRVERTRIAVHGTQFRVERDPNGVRVQVSEGVVAVGQAGEPGAWTLTAPSTGRFDLEGQRLDQKRGDSTEAPASAHPALDTTPPARSASAAPRADADLNDSTERPTMSLEKGALRAEAAVQSCFEQSAVDRGDLRVSAQTNMTLEVSEDGRIAHITFVPPLAPAVVACVDEQMGQARFEPVHGGARVERHLVLEN